MLRGEEGKNWMTERKKRGKGKINVKRKTRIKQVGKRESK